MNYNQRCPHCNSKEFVKHCRYNGRQRYKCKSCDVTFTILTGTPCHGIKKQDKWQQYFKIIMTEGFIPIAKMAERLNISIPTSFDWRHKILSGMKQDGAKFEGITEIDDLRMLYSQKGRKGLKYRKKRGGSNRSGNNNFQVRILITADRKGTLDMSVVRIGRLKKSDIVRKIGGRISKKTILTSDKHNSISSFAKDLSIKHITFDSKNHIANSQHHVQYINNITSRYDTIINRVFRGVSTKYLQNYANWFVTLESIKKKLNEPEEIFNKLLKQNYAWDLFTNTEEQYKYFIQTYSQRTYRCPVIRSWKSQNWNSRINQTHNVY